MNPVSEHLRKLTALPLAAPLAGPSLGREQSRTRATFGLKTDTIRDKPLTDGIPGGGALFERAVTSTFSLLVDMRMQSYEQARADAEMVVACTQTGGIITCRSTNRLSQVYTRLSDKASAKKYTDLTREAPPPVRGE